MLVVQTISDFFEEFAPPALAEEWDNVGLLVGAAEQPVRKVMTCLTVTGASAAEAIEAGAQLIITHHPLPFRPLQRLTTETTPGRLLLDLIGAGIAVYSPHTAFDSAAAGINQRLAEGLCLADIRPLVGTDQAPGNVGSGRYGQLRRQSRLSDLAERLKEFLSLDGLHLAGDPARLVRTVAVACGSAGSLLEPARAAGCDVLVIGETGFHTCLEAQATGVSLLLPGHYASERFAVVYLAEVLAKRFDELTVWASRRESDPLRWV